MQTHIGVDPDSKWGGMNTKAMDALAEQILSSHFTVSGKGTFKVRKIYHR